MAQNLQPAAPPAPEMVSLFRKDPQSGVATYIEVPPDRAQEAQADGWMPEIGPGKAALMQGANSLAFKFGDELAGAANAAGELPSAIGAAASGVNPSEAFAPVSAAYKAGRDPVRATLDSARAQQPEASLLGDVAGGIPAALAMPGVGGAALAGGIMGLGETKDITDPVQVGKDVATSAALSAAIPAGVKGLQAGAKAAGPLLEKTAGDALLASTGVAAEDLGSNAGRIAQTTLNEPGVVPDALSLKGATAKTLNETLPPALNEAGQAMSASIAPIDATGAHVSARQLAKDIYQAASDAARLKPELSRHIGRAVRAIDTAGFDANYARAVAQYGEADAKAMAEQAPWMFIDGRKGMTLAETQGVLGDLRKLGAYPERANMTAEEMTARKDIYSPAWNTGAQTMRDTATRVGGPAAGEAVGSARQRYADLITMYEQIEKAAKVARKEESVPKLVGRMALGALAGHTVGGTPGAVLGGTAEMLGKVAQPRAAKALMNAADFGKSGAGPESAAFAQAFSKYFAGQPEEKQAAIDLKMQELMPKYREMRQAAAKEEQDAAGSGQESVGEPLQK